jgi:pyrroline-5-carboxylate reductase
VGGMGKMGSALSHAWQKAGMPKKSITINDVHGTGAKSLDKIHDVPQCVILAVKPQSMNDILPELAEKFGNKPLYISIAAGKTTAYLKKHLGDVAIVRAMPNTPALIGAGVSALYANKKVTGKQKKTAEKLLQAAGKTVWVSDESHMDAVTAISGSGPAYVFLFLQSLIEAGVSHGLPEKISRQLAIETLIGSSKLAASTKESLTKLRENVTSKGGTTEAALAVLMKNSNLQSLLTEAVAKAVSRSKELA